MYLWKSYNATNIHHSEISYKKNRKKVFSEFKLENKKAYDAYFLLRHTYHYDDGKI